MAMNSHVGAEIKCGSSEQQEYSWLLPHLSSPLVPLLVSELTIFDFAFSPYFFILNYVYVDMGVWMHTDKGLLEARRGSHVWSWSYWQFWEADSGPLQEYFVLLTTEPFP